MTALQCPSCGHIHNSGEAESGETFRCGGCRRLLSVPVTVTAEARRTAHDDTDDSFPLFTSGSAGSSGSRTSWTRPPAPTQAPPDVDRWRDAGNGRARPWSEPDYDVDDETGPGVEAPLRPAPPARPAPKPDRRAGRVPVWMRALVWALALGVGLVVVAAVLRAIGILDVDSVIDAYAGSGIGRYRVVLVFIPLWAALSSLLAHVVLEWAVRRRAKM